MFINYYCIFLIVERVLLGFIMKVMGLNVFLILKYGFKDYLCNFGDFFVYILF